jgi:NitT/TauT family transport system substrate-binding protein
MSITRREFIMRSALAAAALTIAPEACGGSSTSTTARSVKVSSFHYGNGVSTTSITGYLETLWAEFAQKRGITFQSEAVSPTTANQVFASNRVDLISFSPTVVINLQVQGAGKPKVIVGSQPVNDYVIVADKTKVPTVRDLAGRSLGISAPGTISQTIPQLALSKAGLNLQSANVKLVAIGDSGARATALLSGKIDATGLYHDDGLTVLSKNPNMFILLDTAKTVPFVFSAIQATAALLGNADNREGLILALMARAEMLKYVVTKKQEFTSRYLAAFPQASPSVVSESYDTYVQVKMWDPDLVIDLNAYQQTIDLALQAQPPLVQGNVPVKEWVDTSLRDEAIKRLGGIGWWKK